MRHSSLIKLDFNRGERGDETAGVKTGAAKFI
jgi:hypothetical protein